MRSAGSTSPWTTQQCSQCQQTTTLKTFDQYQIFWVNYFIVLALGFCFNFDFATIEPRPRVPLYQAMPRPDQPEIRQASTENISSQPSARYESAAWISKGFHMEWAKWEVGHDEEKFLKKRRLPIAVSQQINSKGIAEVLGRWAEHRNSTIWITYSITVMLHYSWWWYVRAPLRNCIAVNQRFVFQTIVVSRNQRKNSHVVFTYVTLR